MSQEKIYPAAFNEMALSDSIKNAVNALGFEKPTEIQSRAIPEIMSGKDVIGRSHTGTGKTLAFGIPAVEYCIKNPSSSTQALILCPTRELAMQVCDEIRSLIRYTKNIRTVCVYGGKPIQTQIPALRQGANIVVGTPGRVMDHIKRKTLRLDELDMIVLDEADEMLDMGFREDIESILSFVPNEHQTLLFSATMPQAILDITEKYQKEPVIVETASGNVRTIDTVEQYYFDVPMGQKSDALALLLYAHKPKLCMIFCNTKKMVEELGRCLSEHGFNCSCLHGDIPQQARTAVMNAFKTGRTPILICTDVAARGIDVDDVDVVYNYDIPQDYEYYIHRIGRTGRAGREGVSYTLAAGRRQISELHAISKFTGAKITRKELPQTEDIISSKQQEIKNKILLQISKPSNEQTNKLVVELLEHTSAERLAEAALDVLIESEMSSVPKLLIPQENGRVRGSSLPEAPEGYLRLRFGVGRAQHAAPNHIVAAIADATRIPGKMIRKIYCFNEYSIVEVPAKFKNLIIRKTDGTKIAGHTTSVRVYDDKPVKGGDFRKKDGKIVSKKAPSAIKNKKSGSARRKSSGTEKSVQSDKRSAKKTEKKYDYSKKRKNNR